MDPQQCWNIASSHFDYIKDNILRYFTHNLIPSVSSPPAANARKCDRRRFSYSISPGLLPQQPQRFLNDCYPVALTLSVMKVFGKQFIKLFSGRLKTPWHFKPFELPLQKPRGTEDSCKPVAYMHYFHIIPTLASLMGTELIIQISAHL